MFAIHQYRRSSVQGRGPTGRGYNRSPLTSAACGSCHYPASLTTAQALGQPCICLRPGQAAGSQEEESPVYLKRVQYCSIITTSLTTSHWLLLQALCSRAAMAYWHSQLGRLLYRREGFPFSCHSLEQTPGQTNEHQ